MAIGDAVRKYQEQKAIDAAAEAVEEAAKAEARAARMSAREAAEPPQPYTPPPPSTNDTMAAVLAQMTALLEKLATAPKTDAGMETAAKQVELIERLIHKTHPENVDHPGISIYSYPEGDVAHPKPELKCKMFWVGYEMRPETLTPQEIDLLNRLEPGEYRVTKADGVGIPFRVAAKNSDKLDAHGKPTIAELAVWFPCKNEARQNHMSMVNYLQQALGERIPTVAELMKELSKLKHELEQARAGVVGVI